MRIPERIRPGSTVGLVAASSPVPPERLKPSVDAIERLGLKTVVGESCRAKHGFLAGSDEIRARDINEMFADNAIEAVFCIRGGYGSARILPLLDFEIIKKNTKIFAGYSDVTALHTAFNQSCGFVTYHSPMASTELYKGVDSYTMQSFKENIFTGIKPSLKNADNTALVTLFGGKSKGTLCGGNLTLLAGSLGTEYEIDTTGKILFLEDIDEEPYRIDRMLTQMKQAGKLSDCNGIILGAFTNCKADDEGKSLSLDEIFGELILSEKKPVLSGFSCGHCLPTLTLPLGMDISLDADNKIITVI